MTKLLIVDDHAIIRQGIIHNLNSQKDSPYDFVEAETLQQARELMLHNNIEAVLLDISLRKESGLDLLHWLQQNRSHIPVLVLSMHSEEQYGKYALSQGAAGYLTKDSPAENLRAAVDAILNQGRYISPNLANYLADSLRAGPAEALHETLSPREVQILRLIGSGRTPTEIAAELCLSVKTVSTYRSRIKQKIKLNTTTEMIKYCVNHHLVD